MIDKRREENFESVRPVIPERNANDIEVTREVDHFCLKLRKCYTAMESNGVSNSAENAIVV